MMPHEIEKQILNRIKYYSLRTKIVLNERIATSIGGMVVCGELGLDGTLAHEEDMPVLACDMVLEGVLRLRIYNSKNVLDIIKYVIYIYIYI